MSAIEDLPPPIPEILRGKLDGNNKEQYLALKEWQRDVALYERGLLEPQPRPFLVEVPVTGFRVYRVLAVDAIEAGVLVADGEGELVGDEVEEERDIAIEAYEEASR